MSIELKTLTPRKWIANFGSVMPTLDASNDVYVGDFAIDSSLSANNQWICTDSTTGSPLWVPRARNISGNTVFVDSAYGNDTTAVKGDGSRPFLTIAAALASCSSGYLVAIASGTYNLAAGVTIPTGVTLEGANSNAVIIQMLGVTADTTLLTMGSSSRVTDVTLNLTTTGNYALTTVLWPGNTAQTSKLRNAVVYATKTTDTGTKAVNGILVHSTGMPDEEITAIRATTITVASTGTGNNRAVLVDTSISQFHIRDTNLKCTGSGSSIAAEINIAGGQLLIETGNILGTTADISQTAGTLRTSSWLRGHKSNGISFDSIILSSVISFGAEGSLNNGIRFMKIGSGTDSATPFPIMFPRDAIFQKLCFHCQTPPGGTDYVTATLMVNGAPTSLTATNTGSTTDAMDYVHSVTVLSTDQITMMVAKSGGTPSNLYVTLEAY